MVQSLDVLPDAERDAISLAFLDGHSYRRVATLLGAPEGTVKGQIRRGLVRLRKELVEAGIGSER